MFEAAKTFVKELGFPEGDLHQLPESTARFPDGAQYRIEIPSVEGPVALRAVVEEAEKLGVTIHRVSQGSGIMLLTDADLSEMAKIGRDSGIEVCLFLGPRATFDLGAQAHMPGGKSIGLRASGMDQVVYSLEEVRRACEFGIRSILVADEGVIWAVNEGKKHDVFPSDLVIKASVSMGPCNPISVKIMAGLGANTYNVPTDLSLPKLAAIRQAVDIPIDIYVEAPDDYGGFMRYYEIPQIIRSASPVYIKFGLRNAPNVYPSGSHLDQTAAALVREKVRRAKMGCELIARHTPDLVISQARPADLGIPIE